MRSLPTLLSQTLVAFTIEFDNEAEHQLPHRTTNRRSTALDAPWLVSMAMWFNCMKHVSEKGIAVRELERQARTKTNLNGMERWRYITVAPDPSDRRPKPPRADWIIRATPGGRQAQQIWQPLFDVIEKRWQARFGALEMAALRESLLALIGQIKLDLPDFLPILEYGLYCRVSKSEPPAQPEREDSSTLALPALLSKVLLAFTLEFESESELSLPIGANVLRLFGEKDGAEALRVRDLPRLSGVSKEAIAIALSFLTKRGYAKAEPEAQGSRIKALKLTPKGQHARATHNQLLTAIEKRWQRRFGKDTILQLLQSLEPLAGDASRKSPLFLSLEPYPENWRASIPRAELLPHCPMVLHRGGYPDGS
jgi:DNA-binding MarR family transcriptional regulator